MEYFRRLSADTWLICIDTGGKYSRMPRPHQADCPFRVHRIRDSDGAPTSTVHRRWHRYRIAHQSQGETLKTPALIRTHPGARTRVHIADQQANDSVRPVPAARERLLSGRPVRPPNAVEANSSCAGGRYVHGEPNPPGIGVKQANESRSKRKSGLRRSHPCG